MALLFKFWIAFSCCIFLFSCFKHDPRIQVLKKYDKNLENRKVVFVVRDDFCPSCIRTINSFLKDRMSNPMVFSIFYFNGATPDLGWYFDSHKENQILIRPFKERDPFLDSTKVIFLEKGEIVEVTPLHIGNYKNLLMKTERLLDPGFIQR